MFLLCNLQHSLLVSSKTPGAEQRAGSTGFAPSLCCCPLLPPGCSVGTVAVLLCVPGWQEVMAMSCDLSLESHTNAIPFLNYSFSDWLLSEPAQAFFCVSGKVQLKKIPCKWNLLALIPYSYVCFNLA